MTTRLTYLTLFIASNYDESNEFFKEVRQYKWLPVDRPHTIYYIALHRSLSSHRNGIWEWRDGVLKGPIYTPRGPTWNAVLHDCIRHLPLKSFDGFIYSGHGGAINVGRWVPAKTPFFKLCDLITIFLQNKLSFPVMCMNSCYMGSFISLLEYERIASWVTADPGYTGWSSITATRAFWSRKGAIGPWLQQCCEEFAARYHKPNYPCVMAFDLRVMPALLHTMKQTNPMRWSWDRSAMISRYDVSTYDLLTVLLHTAHRTPHENRLIQLTEHMMRYSPICKEKRGMSVQYGRIVGVEARYEGSRWWDYWKTVNPFSISGSLDE